MRGTRVIVVIIDFHVHVPFDAEERGVSPRAVAEEILRLMDADGVDAAVVLPVAPYVSNEYVARVVECEPKRLVGFASVVPNPADKAAVELRRAVEELGLVGLKLHPGMQGFCLRNPHVWRILRLAGELGVPVLIDAMLGDFSSLHFKATYAPWANTVEDYALLPFVAPETRIVLAHMGGSFRFEDILMVAASGSVYVDTSYSILTVVEKIGAEGFARYVRALGAEKFVFGSDTVPGLTPREYSAKVQIEAVRRMPLTATEVERILWRNAAELLGAAPH